MREGSQKLEKGSAGNTDIFTPKILELGLWPQNSVTSMSFLHYGKFSCRFQLICIWFVFFVSLLEFIYNIIVFVCSNIEGWFCNLFSTILYFDAKYLQWKIYFLIQLQKKCNHPPHQSLTPNNNSPSSPAMGLKPMTSGLPAQCLIHSSTRSLIEIHENLPILTRIRLL